MVMDDPTLEGSKVKAIPEHGKLAACNIPHSSIVFDMFDTITVMVDTPSASGNGQKIVRCAKCHVALWSHYSRRGTALAFVRAGTLNDPCAVTPDVHIFTSTKLPWIALPEGAQVFAEFYDVPKVWPPEALARAQAAREV